MNKYGELLTRFEEGHGEAVINKYTPNRIEISTNANSTTILVLSDVYYPGWKAYVDGKESPVLACNSILRGVPLEKGQHSIILEYSPMSYKIGLIISGLTAIFVSCSIFLPSSRLMRRKLGDLTIKLIPHKSNLLSCVIKFR